jgi:D-tyrosyl-tRNA(Tyr) deacylase
MKVVLQRVAHASVHIDSKEHSSIKQGLLVLLGIEDSDSTEDVLWLSKKIANLRVFSDESGQMNRSLLEIEGSVLVVSQFTLHAKTKKGNRPSYIKAARPEVAILLYESFLDHLKKETQNVVKSGVFGADMQVSLCNDGPVTIIIDTKDKS